MNLSQLTVALHIRAGSNSVRDLMAQTKQHHSTVRYHLTRLAQKRVVQWNPALSRTLHLTPLGEAMLRPYCLLPGGGVGRVELVDLLTEEPGEGMEMTREAYGAGE